jgi:hypothetical protein
MRNNSSAYKSLLLALVVVILAASMVFILSMNRNTDVRSRAAEERPLYPGLPSEVPSEDDCFNAYAGSGGQNPPQGCESYFSEFNDNCRIGFENPGGPIAEGCEKYTERRRSDCVRSKLDNQLLPEGCGEHLDGKPVTIKELVCHTSSTMELCKKP